jgi:transcriptional antiterminator RfaH
MTIAARALPTERKLIRVANTGTFEHDFRAVDIPASFPVGGAWHVVYTNIRCEFRANMGLKAKGFETFLPYLRKRIRHARYTQAVERPLFPRYLFVRFDVEKDEWFDPIKSTDGVEDIIRNNSIPVRIPQAELDPIIHAQKAGEFDLTRKRPISSEYAEGEVIRISAGPFAGFAAEVLATMPDKARAEVALQLFGRISRIALNYDHLEKL